MSEKFEVDFFQLEKLIEASWSGSTILQFCVLQDLVDVNHESINFFTPLSNER